MEQRLSEEERIRNASQLAEAVEERFGVGVSPEAIRRHLLAMGYRWKDGTRYVPSRRPPDPEEERRKARGELEELKKGPPKRENSS